MVKTPSIVKQIRAFKPSEINYAFQKGISYSQLSMYSACPKKWALQYRDGYKISAPSINMTFGTALHEALQHYITVIYDKNGAEADRIELNEYFEERLKETYKKDVKSKSTNVKGLGKTALNKTGKSLNSKTSYKYEWDGKLDYPTWGEVFQYVWNKKYDENK